MTRWRPVHAWSAAEVWAAIERWREIAYRLAGSAAAWPKGTRPSPDEISALDRCVWCHEQYCDAIDLAGDPVHRACAEPSH